MYIHTHIHRQSTLDGDKTDDDVTDLYGRWGGHSRRGKPYNYIYSCIHACMHACIHTYDTYILVCVHTYVCTYVYTYIRICVHTYICTYVHTVYTYVCKYVYTSVCMYIYIHTDDTYIHTFIIHTYIHNTYIHTYIHTYTHTIFFQLRGRIVATWKLAIIRHAFGTNSTHVRKSLDTR